MNSWALAASAAARISARDASGQPYAISSAIEPKNKNGSCNTMPMLRWYSSTGYERMSMPSTVIAPSQRPKNCRSDLPAWSCPRHSGRRARSFRRAALSRRCRATQSGKWLHHRSSPARCLTSPTFLLLHHTETTISCMFHTSPPKKMAGFHFLSVASETARHGGGDCRRGERFLLKLGGKFRFHWAGICSMITEILTSFSASPGAHILALVRARVS